MEINFNVGKSIYIIDTSALITLDLYFKHDSPVFGAIWEEMEEMIINGTLRTIDFVEAEINKYQGKEDFLKKWIKKWNRLFVYPCDIIVFNAAKPIINEEFNTGFFDAKKQAVGIEEADPYLIAYCTIYESVLITSEGKDKPNKIPIVASKHGVKTINVEEFLEERGLKMIRTKQ